MYNKNMSYDTDWFKEYYEKNKNMPDINININLLGDISKLRSKKNVMLDGQPELPPAPKNVLTDLKYFINADSQITTEPNGRIIDGLKGLRSPMII